jgi:uncharacterized protein (TIGR00106 family)
MKVIVDLCVIPIGVGVSVSQHVKSCLAVIRESGLEHKTHAYGTNIEGEWDDVFLAIKTCHEKLHQDGAPRISSSLKIGTRIDKLQSMQDKLDSVSS